MDFATYPADVVAAPAKCWFCGGTCGQPRTDTVDARPLWRRVIAFFI